MVFDGLSVFLDVSIKIVFFSMGEISGRSQLGKRHEKKLRQVDVGFI